MKKTFLKSMVAAMFLAAQGIDAQDNKPAAPATPDAKPAETTQPLKGIVKATLETSKGTIELELDADKAPLSVANFVNYAKKGHYDGTIFHRVIPGFMVQGGGMEPGMKQKGTRKPVANEATNGVKNKNYTVAMARTSEPHSATAQFFINVADNDFLDYTSPSANGWGYCVFGKVVAGKDVVDKIKAVPTATVGFHQNVPKDDVLILTAEEVVG